VLERARELVEGLGTEQGSYLGRRERRAVLDEAAVPEAQEPGAKAQPHRALEVSRPFRFDSFVFECRRVLASQLGRGTGWRPSGLPCDVHAANEPRDRHSDDAESEREPHEPRQDSGHITDPAPDGLDAISEPLQRSAKRTWSGISSIPTILEDLPRVLARSVGIDALQTDNAEMEPVARRSSNLAIIICTSNASPRMRRSKYRTTTAAAANGVVMIDATALAVDCAITSALGLSVDAIAQTSATPSPNPSTNTSNWLSQTTPNASQNRIFVNANDRPSALKTPVPSRISTGMATLHTTDSQIPGTKQATNPAMVATVTTIVNPMIGSNRRPVSRIASAASPL
jgi:hypothetical protein